MYRIVKIQGANESIIMENKSAELCVHTMNLSAKFYGMQFVSNDSAFGGYFVHSDGSKWKVK